MASVGETLAEERRRRGRTIADVESATRIRARLIEALENGRYDELPSSAYVKGYIQNYAQYLELPSRPLLDQYAAEMRLQAASQPDERGPLDLPADPVVPKREHAAEMPMRTWATIVAVLTVGGLLVWGGVSLFKRDDAGAVPAPPLTAATETVEPDEPEKPLEPTDKKPKTGEQKPDAEAVAPDDSTEPTSTEVTETEGQGEPQSKPFTLRLSIASGQASWLRVEVDGLKAYEGTLEGGESREWRVSKEAKLRVGRPSAVTLTRDGKNVEIVDSGNIGIVELSTAGE